jgi:hypothetical protein
MEAAVGLGVAIGTSYLLLLLLPSSTAHNLLDRIYISGDTLMVGDLKAIPEHYKGQNIDLMLIRLSGTVSITIST